MGLAADLGISLVFDDPLSAACANWLSDQELLAGLNVGNGFISVMMAAPRNQYPDAHEAAEHFIAATVLPKALDLAGRLVLHGGCVELGRQTALFIGTTGVGKSTLTVSFSLEGYPAWCDDAVMVEVSERVVTSRPISRKMHLRKGAQVGLLGGAYCDEPLASRLSYVCDKTVLLPPPVSAIFVINASCEKGDVFIQELSPADAAMAVVANSFAFDPDDASAAARRMKMASDLVRQVPVFGLHYPRDFEALPKVRREVLRVVSSLDKMDVA